MTLLDEAASGLGAVLLPVVTGLLLEELTFGGLVRLLIAPWPKTGESTSSYKPSSLGCERSLVPGASSSREAKCNEPDHHQGEGPCSH